MSREGKGHTSEGLFAARDDNSANFLVRLIVIQRIVELAHQSGRQGIEGLGAVQCNWYRYMSILLPAMGIGIVERSHVLNPTLGFGVEVRMVS